MAQATLSHFFTLSSSSFSRLGYTSRFLRKRGSFSPLPLTGEGFRYCCSASTEVTSPSTKKRVVSGVQPTGSVHLGNYLGAIKNWVALQDTYETLFFIVDLHAITLPYDTQQLGKATRDTAALYLACGVDISKASVFVQSHVRAHVDLMWLLSASTPIGWLQKMIQFKEKSRKEGGENVGVALLTYPVLMASDILLYQSDFVPVGEDQKQHLELARELAQRVNHLYGGRKWKKLGGRGGSIFKIPEPLIPQAGARVMSLTDGLSKMSKSAPSDQSRINLLDSKDLIADKIKRCKTDSFAGLEFDNAERPECNNLLSVYQIVSEKTKEEVMEECKDMSWGTFKPLLADALIEHLSPIQVRYQEITAETEYLDKVLSEGAERATEIADATVQNLKQAMGFYQKRFAAESKKGFNVVSDNKDAYSFLYPFGWQEVVIEGQDKVYKDVIEPLESVSVNLVPTSKQTIKEFGPPKQIAETLVQKVLAPANQKTTLIDASEHDVDGKTYYQFEFTVQARNYTRHALGTITVFNGKFYTLTTGANERRWEKMKDRLHTVVDSFKITV